MLVSVLLKQSSFIESSAVKVLVCIFALCERGMEQYSGIYIDMGQWKGISASLSVTVTDRPSLQVSSGEIPQS